MNLADPKLLLQLAEEGDAEAQVKLGKMRLAQERYEDAATWLRKAANSEHADAQCLLGSLLSEGLGVDQDQEAAAYWLRMAAEQGHSQAQLLLAQTFESGVGVQANRAVAAQWYRRAAEGGDEVAQLRYGQLLMEGAGITRDLTEAAKWLQIAAKRGSADAQVELARCLLEIGSAQEAVTWARAAAEQDSPTGSYCLASLLEKNAADMQEAESWYRKAADQGVRDAQIRLAQLYAEGKIVAADPAEAERWLQMAISKCNAGDGADEAPSTPQALAATSLSSVRPETSAVSGVVGEYSPGTIIDNKYFIMSILGKGGMCRVYKAKHLLMNRTVAIKMLLPELATNHGLVKRFQREAQTASALSHPNVVSIFDLGVVPDGKPFIVMDYLEGESLEERIENKGALAVAQFLSIFRQVCSGLEAAHESGIIHRDMKPSNIMLTSSKNQTDVVKVVDFGLAKVLEDNAGSHKLTKSGEVFGTLAYMSPEQCLGHPLDARTDIYSVGCAMYEALSGGPVFSAATPYEFMSKHINTAPEPLVPQVAQCSPDLERIILKTLAKDREQRYQSMTELLADLSSIN